MKKHIRSHAWSKGRSAFPSIFFTLLSPSDKIVLQRQVQAAKGGRRFSPDLVKGVPHRCGHGCPQVILCDATRGGEPFPTSFWLVCPHLLRVVGRLEAANGVADMERFLSLTPGAEKEWMDYHVLHARLRLSLMSGAEKKFLRIYKRGLYRALCRGGVGGIGYAAGGFFVKCLHLQVASYLGMRRHPASGWLMENIRPGWECASGACVEPNRQADSAERKRRRSM